jgi:hypothetical protein
MEWNRPRGQRKELELDGIRKNIWRFFSSKIWPKLVRWQIVMVVTDKWGHRYLGLRQQCIEECIRKVPIESISTETPSKNFELIVLVIYRFHMKEVITNKVHFNS